MRIFIRRADIFQADTEPISSCLLNNRVIMFPTGQGLLCNGVIHQVPETAPQHSTSVSYKIFGISKYYCEFWSNGRNKTAREVAHIFICPPHGQTCGNAVFNDPDHLVLSFSHVSNELCICGDLWRAMLSPVLLPLTETLHGFFTGSQLGKAKLLNLRK